MTVLWCFVYHETCTESEVVISLVSGIRSFRLSTLLITAYIWNCYQEFYISRRHVSFSYLEFFEVKYKICIFAAVICTEICIKHQNCPWLYISSSHKVDHCICIFFVFPFFSDSLPSIPNYLISNRYPSCRRNQTRK